MRINAIKLAILGTIIFSALFFGSSIRALSPFDNSVQGVEISPTLVELNAQKGNTYNISLNLRNITNADLTYSVSVADFTATDETGSPKIAIDSLLPNTASIRTWVNIVSTLGLESNQNQSLTAQITVPEDAEPGGHYGVIRFTNGAPGLADSSVGLSSSAGVLILIRVDGEIIENANLVEFFSAKNNKQSPFFESGPITLVTRIENKGNIHLKPSGSVQVRNIFGNLVDSVQVNEDKSNILPNSIRRYETTYDSKFMIGRYSADLAIGYGSTGQAITSTIFFWVIPYRLIIVGIFALGTIIFILLRLIKVYNRHIIAKSKNEKTNKSDKAPSNKK